MHLRPHLIGTAVVTLVAVGLVPTGPAGAAEVTCFDQPATIVATVDGQTLTGTEGPDVISSAGFGNVRIDALGGDDLVCSAPRVDGRGSVFLPPATVDGGAGNDSVALQGEATGHGGPGDDLLVASNNSATAYGDDGNDTLRLEYDEWGYGLQAFGGAGDDVLSTEGPVGWARLSGGDGNDRLSSTGGTQIALDPGTGDDVVSGDPATMLDYTEAAPVVIRAADGVADGQGHDIFTGVTRFSGGVGADTFYGTGGPDTYWTGDFFADTADKGLPRHELEAPDVVHGYGGDDVLSVGRGTVIGGDGADVVSGLDARAWGGAGDDHIFLAGRGEAGGGPGDDVIDATVGRTAPTLGGELVRPRFRLSGGPGDDRIHPAQPRGGEPVGCGAAPICRNDLSGGPGFDTLDLSYLFWKATVDLKAGTLRSGDVRGSTHSFERVVGTERGDHLLGSRRDDVLEGRGGNDVLRGRGGHDTARGGAGRDRCTAEVRRSC